MDLLFLSFIIVCCCLLTTTLSLLPKKPPGSSKLPPGPRRLPIIGNLHNLRTDNLHKSLAELASTHGPLMSLKLGQLTTIVASSPEIAKHILQKHDLLLANRHQLLSIHAHDHHLLSMLWLPLGPKWRTLRKLSNTHLFTPHKLNSNQDLRRHKVLHLLQDVRRNASEGKPLDIGRAAFSTTFAAISTTVFSTDLMREETSMDLKEVVRSTMDEAGKPNLGDFFPVLGFMDVQGIQRRLRGHFDKMLNLFGRKIDQRLEKRKEAEAADDKYVSSNDMLDTLLDVMADEKKKKNKNGDDSLDVDDIKHLFLDLFVAGTDTTSTTLEWAMAELLHNPKALAKARDELRQTIGKDNHLEESDILRLPYLQAVIKETFRLHPPIPMLGPRMAAADVEILGFTVPKGAQILVNAWAIARDSATWTNPNSFVPERFMGSEIDVRGNSCEFIPFGSGRRVCPGLPLAMRMFPMMLGSLIHWFDWKIPGGVEPQNLDLQEKYGMGGLHKAKPLLLLPLARG